LVYHHYPPSPSRNPTERNRVVSYQVTEHAKPLVNLLLCSFLHAFCSNSTLLKCGSTLS
jgi:hypothetical protein